MHVPKLNGYAIRALRRAARTPQALLGRTIGAHLREQVILRVSSVNSCPTCSAVHGLIARIVGFSSDEIRAARAGTVDDERVAVALRFAEQRTTSEENTHPEVTRRFEDAFSPAEQQEISAVVDLFTFMNRLTNSVESVLPGARWRRSRLGLDAGRRARVTMESMAAPTLGATYEAPSLSAQAARRQSGYDA